MKKVLSFIFTAIIVAATFSCNKTTDPQPTNNNTGGTTDTNFYFTAKIDGTNWTADMSSTNTYLNSAHAGSLTIQASLTDVTTGVFLVNLYNYTGAGSHTVGTGGTNSYARYITGSVGKGTYSAWKAETPGSTTTGTFTITKEENNIVEGTFSFDGYSEEKKTTKKITEGKFRMKKK